jgi:hypothetical protein
MGKTRQPGGMLAGVLGALTFTINLHLLLWLCLHSHPKNPNLILFLYSIFSDCAHSVLHVTNIRFANSHWCSLWSSTQMQCSVTVALNIGLVVMVQEGHVHKKNTSEQYDLIWQSRQRSHMEDRVCIRNQIHIWKWYTVPLESMNSPWLISHFHILESKMN